MDKKENTVVLFPQLIRAAILMKVFSAEKSGSSKMHCAALKYYVQV